jgi:hypothetical protein
MKFKHTAILLGLLFAGVVGLIVYSWIQGDEAETGDVLFPGLAGLKAEDIDSFEYVRTQPKDEKIVFTRVEPDKRWAVTSPYPAAIEQRDIDALIEAVIRLKPVPFGELKSDPEAHGLAAPSLKLTLRQGSVKSATLNVGTTTIGGSNAVTFVTTSASPNRPLAVRKSDLTPLFRDPQKADGEAWAVAKSLTDFRQRRLLGTGLRDPYAEAAALRVKTGDRELALKKGGPEQWTFVSPAAFGDADAGGDTEINPQVFTGVRPLMNALTLIQAQSLTDVIENPPKEDFAKYGLKADDPKVVRIELTDANNRTETLYLGQVVDEKATPVKRYARLEGDSCIAMVPVDRYDALVRTVADPSAMRNRDLFPNQQMSRIDAVDVAAGASTVKLRRFGPKDKAKWYVVGGTGDPKDAHFFAVDQLLQTISRPRLATGFPAKPDPADYAPNELKAVVTVWQDGLGETALPEPGKPSPEPPVKGDPVVLTFGKKSGETVAVKRTEKSRTSEYLVPDHVLAAVVKNRLAFLSAGVPTFATNLVAKATFDRPGGAVEVAKSTGEPDAEFPLGKWTFVRPDLQKGKLADQPRIAELLGILATLRTQNVVSENPSEADLKTYGLAPAPRLRVSMELTSEPGKIRSYEFGSETADKGFVHARHSGSPLVYTVPRVEVDRLIHDDLRDAQLVRMDRSKLTGIALRGWTGMIPVPPVHEYARKGPDWTCTAPPGVTADPVKVATFLSQVELLRVAKFVGSAKPEHKLDVASGAVEITFKLENAPAIVLTIGSAAEDPQQAYATVSTMPGEVVTIPVTALKAYISTPNGLAAPPKPVVPEKK